MKKIKLTNLSVNKITRKEAQQIKGGNSCGCACYYAESGGSSVEGNCDANYAGGKSSPQSLEMIRSDDEGSFV